ncbi:MAG TPA: hypothetical protein VFX25_04335 [Streptosporangiaceae bacterium]|nr:hypothetical protein [Streptosporangiaceae bacterium]
MNRFRAIIAAGLMLSGALASGALAATPAVASPAPLMLAQARVTAIVHGEQALPGCAVTHFAHANSNVGRTCLQPMTAAQSAAAVSPDWGPCALAYYQNGPFGSTDWENGWADCDSVAGNYRVPLSENDQASVWLSFCSTGVFYAGQPGTSPSASFPAENHGPFPRGAVPNDSLSSIFVAKSCL